jgi:hypothetical protein
MFLFALLGVDAGVWTMFLTRIVEEMSPAYLVFVGLIFVAAKLGYKYLSKKIDFTLDKEKSFLVLLQEALHVITELDETLDQLHGKVDTLRSDHEELLELLRQQNTTNEIPVKTISKPRKPKNSL